MPQDSFNQYAPQPNAVDPLDQIRRTLAQYTADEPRFSVPPVRDFSWRAPVHPLLSGQTRGGARTIFGGAGGGGGGGGDGGGGYGGGGQSTPSSEVGQQLGEYIQELRQRPAPPLSRRPNTPIPSDWGRGRTWSGRPQPRPWTGHSSDYENATAGKAGGGDMGAVISKGPGSGTAGGDSGLGGVGVPVTKTGPGGRSGGMAMKIPVQAGL